MKFTLTAVAALLSTTAIAAPAEERAAPGTVSMVASVPQWTIVNMKRVCNFPTDTSCAWTFAINNQTAPQTPCKFTVTGKNASDTNSNNHVCGPSTISTGWSGQFRAGNGFTTLAVVNNAKKLIAYPAYTDEQLDTNKVVTPNQSYQPQNLPS